MLVMAEGTRKLLGNLFELEDLGAKELKGIAGPMRVWAVLRPRSVESRFEPLHAAGLTALVGREEEFEILLRRWSRAKSAASCTDVEVCASSASSLSSLVCAVSSRANPAACSNCPMIG